MSRKGRRGRSHKGGAGAAPQAAGERAGGTQRVAASVPDRPASEAANEVVEAAPATFETEATEATEATQATEEERDEVVVPAAATFTTEDESEGVEAVQQTAVPALDDGAEYPGSMADRRREDAPEVPPAAPAVDLEDSSYPPLDLDNHFFEGESPAFLADLSEPPPDSDERDPTMILKRTPEVARRRADLQRYVKVAVAAASALCLAALVKVAVAHDPTDEGMRRPTSAAAATPTTEAPALPAVPAVVPPAAEPAPVVAADPAVPTEALPPVAAAPADSAPAPAPVATAAPEVAPADSAAAPAAELDPKAAAKEKSTCRAALERGKLADAIEAGERSVALDPTDGEAWLILGAAYQEKGDMKNARRSYKACIDQGKRGPKYECAAMPH